MMIRMIRTMSMQKITILMLKIEAIADVDLFSVDYHDICVASIIVLIAAKKKMTSLLIAIKMIKVILIDDGDKRKSKGKKS